MRKTGTFEVSDTGGERVSAFVPSPLPPDPPIDVAALQPQILAAEASLARLEIAGDLVPSLDWFIYAFVRKEAVLSSQIEGTQATLMDLLNFEVAHQRLDESPDIEEVCNYIDALTHARDALADPRGLPISMRLLNEVHAHLLKGARGENKKPGEVRKSQNWVGGTRPGNAVYVPPPPDHLPTVLSAFEKYVHASDDLPPIVRAGLLHVQFETIHPYLDGNGRVGRLLVTLLLEHWGLLTKPLLYLSVYLKRHRYDYYRLLGDVRFAGDWEAWLSFFLRGVETIADEAVATSQALFRLVNEDRERLLTSDEISVLAIQVFEKLPRHPVVTAAWIVETFETTKPTAGRAIAILEAAGVLVESTGKKRDRVYAYQRYLDELRTDTEL